MLSVFVSSWLSADVLRRIFHAGILKLFNGFQTSMNLSGVSISLFDNLRTACEIVLTGYIRAPAIIAYIIV